MVELVLELTNSYPKLVDLGFPTNFAAFTYSIMVGSFITRSCFEVVPFVEIKGLNFRRGYCLERPRS